MTCWLGIDLGTSSVRALVLDGSGTVLATGGRSYRISSPRAGDAEQDPEQWWLLAAAAVAEVLADGAVAGRVIDGVGITGQMHGLVCLDGAGVPVRPAIIWPDLRSTAQIRRLGERMDPAEVQRISGMAPTTGQLGPTLAWLAAHEPETIARTRHALLPKDFLRYRLTGRIHTERSDACGTLLFDIRNDVWSDPIIEALGVEKAMLPEIVGCTSVVGGVVREAALLTGLLVGTPVVAGAGDQAAAAVALGMDAPGRTSVALSSGGTVVQATATADHDLGTGLHTLCSADGRWLLMGATLSAGLALSWLVGVLAEPASTTRSIEQLVGEAGRIAPGAEGLLFLPYLAGERTPLLDPAARGCFLGLDRGHSAAHLTRAVLEGVAFAMRDCLDTVIAAGSRPPSVIASGGGTRNPLWRQILTDILGCRIAVSAHDEHSATGAAMLAALGIGGLALKTPESPGFGEPDPVRHGFYDRRFDLFHRAYRQNRSILHALTVTNVAGE